MTGPIGVSKEILRDVYLNSGPIMAGLTFLAILMIGPFVFPIAYGLLFLGEFVGWLVGER